MAVFSAVNSCVVGGPTKKVQHDQLLDNTIAIQEGSVAFAKTVLDGATSDPAAPASGDVAVAYRSDQAEPVLRRSSGATEFLRVGGVRQRHAGLLVRTHPDASLRQSRIVLQRLREVIFADGYRLAPSESAFPLTVDLAASGANGLDQGAEEASTWYGVYLIRKSTDGTLALLLHKANRLVVTEQTTVDASTALRDASARTKIAQSFQVSSAGTLRAALLQWGKTGTPTGGNVEFWVTVEADSAGDPSGTPLATGAKLLATDVNTTARGYAHTFFGAQAISLPASTTRWLVAQGDFTLSGANYLAASRNSAGGYGSGSAKSFDGSIWSALSGDLAFVVVHEVDDAALVLPTGYDQSVLLDYAYNNSSGHLEPFVTHGEWHLSLSASAIGTKLGISDTASIGNVLYDGTQLPPVALVEVRGVGFNQAGAGSILGLGPLDGGMSVSGAMGDPRVALKVAGSGGDEYAHMTAYFQWQMAQMYKGGGNNNQSFTPKAWRVLG
jgi:hypothetical protein